MRSDDPRAPDADEPEPPGGHARRRFEQELTARFGTDEDAAGMDEDADDHRRPRPPAD
jgi:hypothetical protein